MKQIQIFILAIVIILYTPLVGAGEKEPGKVFILATPHLYKLNKTYDLAVLDNTLNKLENFRPDVIAIESLPPYVIASMAARQDEYEGILVKYADRNIQTGKIAQKALSLSWESAYYRISDPNVNCPTDTNELTCILTYIAAYDYYTGLLKWNQASIKTRRLFKEQYRSLDDNFTKRMTSSNEYISIAVKLAIKLGHTRLFPVDDHSEKGRLEIYLNGLPDYTQNPWSLLGDVSKEPYIVEMDTRYKKAADRGDLLPFYKWLNRKETGRRDEEFQWQGLIDNDANNRMGASVVTAWETRNLRMASHLTQIMTEKPGQSLLYIVGSGHKPILDRYFESMRWVDLLSADDVLGK